MSAQDHAVTSAANENSVDPTENQRRAADPGASVWVSASAGSGKTKVLTDRVMALLLHGVRPERLLCITFTKAAAAEMALRINDRLAGWTRAEDSVVADEIAAILGRAPESAELRRARRLFAQVLDAPGGLKIQTVHGFCQSILGRFPLEAGAPPRFDVVDERGAEEMTLAARDMVLSRAEDDPMLAEALNTISRRTLEDRFGALLTALAGERTRLRRFLRPDGAGFEAAIDRLYAILNARRGVEPEEVERAACQDGAFDQGALGDALAAMRAFGLGKRGSGAQETLTDWLEADQTARPGLYPAYRRLFFKTDGGPMDFAWLYGKRFIETHLGVCSALEAEQARLEDVGRQASRQTTATATEALIRLSRAIIARYDRLKAARGVLDYDDLILRTRDLLTNVNAAWVMFKLDGGLEHILVDEAQDTSPEQWEIVRALADEFFTGEGQFDDTPRTLFVVGDVKQSIYSFQRADPAEFLRMRRHFSKRLAESIEPLREVPLEVSFRSTSAVLRAVDHAFASTEARDGVAPPDEAIRHFAHRAGAPGHVALWPLVQKIDEEPEDVWQAAAHASPQTPPARRLAQGIAAQVADWIGGRRLPSRQGRPASAGDILILVRSRTPQLVDSLIGELKQRGVSVAGLDRMHLGEQIAVMDMMALVRFALLPEDDLTLATVLKGPFITLNEEKLFKLAYDRGEASLWSRLRDMAKGDETLSAACDWLSGLLDRADRAPPYEFYAQLLHGACPRLGLLTGRALTGREALSAQFGVEAEDPVDEFLSLALDYERGRAVSLQGFVQWFDAGDAEIKRDMEAGEQDALRIMTVHGAKGLQAPIVILADAGRGASDVNTAPVVHWVKDAAASSAAHTDVLPVWSPNRSVEEDLGAAARAEKTRRDQEEHRRLLYVAMTRAEDALYLCGIQTGRAPAPDSWHQTVWRGLAESPDAVLEPFESGDGWQGESLSLRIGDEGAVAALDPAAEAAAAQIPLAVADPPGWTRRPPPAEPAPPRPIAPSRPITEDPPVLSPMAAVDRQGGAARFKRGLLIHRLLQSLPDRAPADRRAAALAFLSRPTHGLDPETVAQISDEVMRVLEHPDFAPLFGPGSRAEAPLTGLIEGPDGPEVVSGQVDRLLVTREAVYVIDYKTLRPPPETPEATPAAYLRQMSAYRAVLTQIFPDRPIRCALLWTDQARLMELDRVL